MNIPQNTEKQFGHNSIFKTKCKRHR